MPTIVARGTVRAGSRMRSAVTLAASNPSSGNKVSATTPPSPASTVPGAGKDGSATVPRTPTPAAIATTAISGAIFKTVVTTCTRPTSVAPARLSSVNNQIKPTEASAPVSGVALSAGKKAAR